MLPIRPSLFSVSRGTCLASSACSSQSSARPSSIFQSFYALTRAELWSCSGLCICNSCNFPQLFTWYHTVSHKYHLNKLIKCSWKEYFFNNYRIFYHTSQYSFFLSPYQSEHSPSSPSFSNGQQPSSIIPLDVICVDLPSVLQLEFITMVSVTQDYFIYKSLLPIYVVPPIRNLYIPFSIISL